jgi:uroporphyrinogen-III synthase
MKNQNHHQMRVFISRFLDSKQSLFYKQLNQYGFTVNGQSMLEFSGIPFQTIPKSHWIFFYSKTAIAYFFEYLPSHFNIQKVKWATIGEASAKYLQKYGVQADFVGTGEPLATAKEFLNVAEGEKVLFARALHSKKSIQDLLNGDIQVVDFVVYNNRKCQNIQKRHEEVLVFTSPMNAQAYLNQHRLFSYQQIVAIGNTTAHTLKKLGIRDFCISDKPNELALASCVLKLKTQQTGNR